MRDMRLIELAVKLVEKDMEDPITQDELDELECEDPDKANFYYDLANLRNDLINMGYDL